MAINDLFTAMKMFKEGVQELSVSRALGAANERVQQVKAAEMDEAEKRNQLQGIANQLALAMGASGAPVSQIQSAVAAVGPKQFANADQAMLEGRLTNNSQLLQMGKDASLDQNANNLAMQHDSQKFTAGENAKNRALQRELKAMEVSRARAGGKLTDTQLNAFTTAIAQEKEFNNLIEQVNRDPSLVGPLDARVPGRGSMYGPDFAKFKVKLKQVFNAYRSAVTGAGASVGELKMLMEAFPDGTEDEEVFKEKALGALEVGKTILATRADVLEAAGKDVSRIRALISGTGETPADDPNIIERTTKDGKKVKVRKRADGSYEEVR